MVFSTNQVRQLYVVTGTMTDAQMQTHARGGAQQAPGKTLLKEFNDWGQHQDPKTCEFFYVSASKDLGHSDIIHRENIRQIKLTKAKDLRMYLPSFTITLSSNLTKANPTTAGDMEDVNKYYDGDVFYVNFSFPGFLNATDEEVETKTVAMRFNYNSDGTVMTSGDANYDDWGAQMAEAITLAFNGRHNLDNDLLSATGTGTTVNIKGKPGQPWYVGVSDNKPNQIVIDNLTWENLHNSALSTLPLENNSNVSIYGTAADTTGTGTTAGVDYIGNGKRTADLEYFCMGERGDQYRNVGWPNVIHTEYLVKDFGDTDEYDYLDIHYYFQGEGVRSDKSEKLITLVGKVNPTANGYNEDKVNNTALQDFYDQLCLLTSSNIPANPTTPTTQPLSATTGEPDVQNSDVTFTGTVTGGTSNYTVKFLYTTDTSDWSTATQVSASNTGGNTWTATATGLSAGNYSVKITVDDGTDTADGTVQTFTIE